jgi:GNAT superfamily N-acetyltransferase
MPGTTMQVVETVTFLEMTSPTRLRPSRPAPAPVKMDEVGEESASLLRSTFDRIGAPYNWQIRRVGPNAWSDERWAERLSEPGVHAWVGRVAGEIAGMVEVEAQPDGDVEIVVFGLVPELIGKGFGANLLTVATRLAWQTEPLDSRPIQRVWLHTCSRDHPHALPNYRRRGFRPFRIEQQPREILT